eukprot:569728-Prymnesium_polylepis.1
MERLRRADDGEADHRCDPPVLAVRRRCFVESDADSPLQSLWRLVQEQLHVHRLQLPGCSSSVDDAAAARAAVPPGPRGRMSRLAGAAHAQSAARPAVLLQASARRVGGRWRRERAGDDRRTTRSRETGRGAASAVGRSSARAQGVGAGGAGVDGGGEPDDGGRGARAVRRASRTRLHRRPRRHGRGIEDEGWAARPGSRPGRVDHQRR